MARQKIHRAGLICYHIDNDDNLSMIFMRPSNPKWGTDTFQIAKGKIEENETAKQAAIREAQEEVGLKPENIIGEVIEIGVFLGRTTMFIAQVKNQYDFNETCDETGETKWMSVEDFIQTGRGLHKPVVRYAVKQIRQNHNLSD